MKPSTEAFLREIDDVCKKYGKRLEPSYYFVVCDYGEGMCLRNLNDYSKGDE